MTYFLISNTQNYKFMVFLDGDIVLWFDVDGTTMNHYDISCVIKYTNAFAHPSLETNT